MFNPGFLTRISFEHYRTVSHFQMFQETQAEIENRDSAWKEWLEDDEEEED